MKLSQAFEALLQRVRGSRPDPAPAQPPSAQEKGGPAAPSTPEAAPGPQQTAEEMSGWAMGGSSLSGS